MIHVPGCKILWLTLCLGCVLSSNVHAEPALQDAYLPQEILEGQRVPLKLTFTWPEAEGDYEIQAPQDIDLKNIALVDVSQSQESYSSPSGQIFQLVLTYHLLPLKPGRGMINSFNVLFRKSDQDVWKTIPVPPLLMNVKPALPLKQISILLAILAAIVLPFVLWLIFASWDKQKREKRFMTDPKQQFYANAIKNIRGLMTRYAESERRAILSECSAELTKVVQTYYDIPLRPATKNQILAELKSKTILAGEFREIENIFNKLEQLRFSTEVFKTRSDIETLKLTLLPYIQSKIVIGEGLY